MTQQEMNIFVPQKFRKLGQIPYISVIDRYIYAELGELRDKFAKIQRAINRP